MSPALASQPLSRLAAPAEAADRDPTSRGQTAQRTQSDGQTAPTGPDAPPHPAAQPTSPATQAAKLGPVRRRMSFDVKGRAAAGIELMCLLERVLQGRGAQCTVNERLFVVTAVVGGEGGGPLLSVRVTLQQQQATLFVVTASVASACPELLCRAFVQLMHHVKADVLHMWQEE